jgi:hypothetical protein
VFCIFLKKIVNQTSVYVHYKKERKKKDRPSAGIIAEDTEIQDLLAPVG